MTTSAMTRRPTGSRETSAEIGIERVEPADWYVGMKDASLQLMVYGDGIRKARVSTDYPGVRIDSLARLDSPNYLLVYLDLSGARPGEMKLTFTLGKRKKDVNYRLKARDKAGEERKGFSNADVLYVLMPDRFAQGKDHKPRIEGMNSYKEDRAKPSARHGGDLRGIRDHLDYFKELGVTTLWLTPVLENNSPDGKDGTSTYHGYAITNYYRVDPRLGTNEDYRQLVAEAHAKGLKVVMDMVFNHCAIEHPWVRDCPSRDWFNMAEWLSGKKADKSKYLQTSYKLTPVLDPYASEVDKRETVDGWFDPSMPDLNQRNPHVIKYLIQNSVWWIETVGIDGIRMDTYPYADREAMALWMKTLEREYPDFNTMGETWVTEPAYTAAWQKDSKLSTVNSHLKTVMDFAFYDRVSKAAHEETDGWWQGMNRIYNVLCYDYLYANPSNVLAFIENHDTDRFLRDGKDVLALKQALALLLTINRIPQLYYGTEVLMNGTTEVTDGNVRKDFPGGFPGDKMNCFVAEGRGKARNDMFCWLSRLLHWRQGNNAIIHGSQKQFVPWKGVYVIARQAEGRNVLTVLNGTGKPAKMEVKRYAEVIAQATEATDVLTGRKVALREDVPLKPRQTLVLSF